MTPLFHRAAIIIHSLLLSRFLGDRLRLREKSPYATGPLSLLPVRLSVTLVYCGQTVGWIKMPLGMEVGIDPSDTVLDGDPAPPQKGTQQLPTFRP